VRCGKCGYHWHQHSADAPQGQDATKAVLQPVSGQLPKVLKKAAPKTLWYVAATAWLLLIVCLAFFFGFRQQVVSLWVPASRLYDVVGLSVPVPGEGLILSNVISKTYEAQGQKPMVLVTGQVVNTTAQKRTVPVLKLELRDDGRRPLVSWELKLPTKQLNPGETVDFLTQQPVENALVNNVLVQFAQSN
jgi:hypothetical protein